MPTRRLFRFGLMFAGGLYLAWHGLVKLSAHRHLAEDEPGSVGAKFGAVVSV